MLAGKLGIDGQTAIGELNDRVGASAIRQRGLYFEHVRRKKIRQQTLKARLTELSTKVRQLQHIVQIVNRVAQRSNLSQLLFGRFQVLLHALELRETLLNILVQFLLYLAGDGEQLGIDPVANRIQTLRRFEVEIFKFGFELGGG